jgi:hypothetical protein
MFSLGATKAGIYPFWEGRRQMSNKTRLQAPEAAFTGHEKNSCAHVHRRYPKLDLSDHASLPTD